MVSFDGLRNVFKKKAPVDSAAEAERQADLSRRITGGMLASSAKPGELGVQMREKMDKQAEVREAAGHVLRMFELAVTKIERPDQYLTTLDEILEARHATPEVVRQVAKTVKSELVTFYQMHGGSGSMIGEKGRPSAAKTGMKKETHLVPEGFATGNHIDSTRTLSNQVDEWAEHWITMHSSAANGNTDEMKIASGQ